MSDPMTRSEVLAAKARADKAPAGPWETDTDSNRNVEMVNLTLSDVNGVKLADTLNADHKSFTVNEETDEDDRWFYLEGPSVDALEFCKAARTDVPRLAATLLEAIDKLKVITLSWQCSHSLDVKESECAKCKAVAFLSKFEGGE